MKGGRHMRVGPLGDKIKRRFVIVPSSFCGSSASIFALTIAFFAVFSAIIRTIESNKKNWPVDVSRFWRALPYLP